MQNKCFVGRESELQVKSKQLKSLCSEMDDCNYGCVDVANFFVALKNMQLIDVTAGADLSELSFINTVMNVNCYGQVLYNTLCNTLLDVDGTQSKDWNDFRCCLIGGSRKEGVIRIIYRYDGWPETLVFECAMDTEQKNDILSSKIIECIGEYSNEEVTYAQLKYASNPTFAKQLKRGWTVDENKSIKLLVGADGCLEVDVWLRTQDFIDHKKGKPVPKQ